MRNPKSIIKDSPTSPGEIQLEDGTMFKRNFHSFPDGSSFADDWHLIDKEGYCVRELTLLETELAVKLTMKEALLNSCEKPMNLLDKLLSSTHKGRKHYITQEQIEALHPLDTHRHDIGDCALVLVSERHGKRDLVELVNALLHKIDALKNKESSS